MQTSSSPHPSVNPTSPASVPVAPAIHLPSSRRPALASLPLLGVGRPADHKAVRPAQEAAGGLRAWTTRRRAAAAPADAPSAQKQVELALHRALAVNRQGIRQGSFLLRTRRESPAEFGARLRAALDAVCQVPSCTPETRAGRERLLAILAAHADELLREPGALPGQGLALGPDGADHRHLFDALMQRLLRPLARTLTETAAPAAAAPADLLEAFGLLESPTVLDHPSRTALVQQGMFALARAFGGERMTASTLSWIESLIFNGQPCEREPAWLRASLIGLALGTGPLDRYAGDTSAVGLRAETLGLDHLSELGPRQIEALWHMPLPLDAAASYAPEQLGAMVVARRVKPHSLRPGERLPGLADLHAKAASTSSPLSPAHLVAFGCAAMRDNIGLAGGDEQADEQRLHRQWLPRYPEEARALWEFGAQLATDPGRALVHPGFSKDEQQGFFRVAVEILAPRPGPCAALLAAEGVRLGTLEAVLRTRPAEYTWAVLPYLSQRLLEAFDEGDPSNVASDAARAAPLKGAPEAPYAGQATPSPSPKDSKGSTEDVTDWPVQPRSPIEARLLVAYDILGMRCLASRRSERAGELDKVRAELARVKSDISGLGRMPGLQRALAAKLAQLLVRLEAGLGEAQSKR